MFTMKMMTIVNIMEWHRGPGEQIKVSRMSISQDLGSVKSVYENRCPSNNFVSEAVKDLVPRGVFEIPVEGFRKVIREIWNLQ